MLLRWNPGTFNIISCNIIWHILCFNLISTKQLTLRHCIQNQRHYKGSQRSSLRIPMRTGSVWPCLHRSSASTLPGHYSLHHTWRCCTTNKNIRSWLKHKKIPWHVFLMQVRMWGFCDFSGDLHVCLTWFLTSFTDHQTVLFFLGLKGCIYLCMNYHWDFNKQKLKKVIQPHTVHYSQKVRDS